MSEVKGKNESSEETLKDLIEASMLFDFYSDLLDEHKREIYGEYVMNDMSLSEISESVGISRQGVYDIIKRCTKQLREYEERLGLVKRFRELKADAGKLEKISEKLEKQGLSEIAAELASVTKEISMKL